MKFQATLTHQNTLAKRLGRSLRLGLLLNIACLCFCQSLYARAATECGQFNLAFYELGALYYKNPQGNYSGIDKDVIEELSRRTGCQFQTSLESRVRIWAQLSSNALDMSVSGIATAEREKFAYFIPYFATRNYVLLQSYLATSSHTMAGFLNDPNLKVAIVKSFKHGANYDEWLAKLRQQNRLIEAADFDSVMRLFLAKRVDAMLALATSLEPLKRRESPPHFIVLDWSPSDYLPHGLVISRSRVPASVVELFKLHIRQMQEDGSLEQIFTQHVGPELAKAMRLKN